MTSAHFILGHLRLDIVSDGYFLMDAGAVFGVVPRIMWEPLAGSPNERNQLPFALNCLLVRGGGRTVLIDTGCGNKIPPDRRAIAYPGEYGHLLANLAALAVHPAGVDAVVNTHLHWDHCGWNTALVHGAAIPTFPNARYYIQRGEWEAAMQPNERTRAAYLADNILPLAQSDRLELVDGEHQVTGEIRFLPAPGHTDAHAAVVLTAGGETAIYIGDLVQHAIQLERSAWVSAFDILPLVSMATKQRVVEQAMRAGSLLISPHIPYPGAGRIRAQEGRPRFTPVRAQD